MSTSEVEKWKMSQGVGLDFEARVENTSAWQSYWAGLEEAHERLDPPMVVLRR